MSNYRIMGKYFNTGRVEELDIADTENEANKLRAEYQMAYGSTWAIWVEIPSQD